MNNPKLRFKTSSGADFPDWRQQKLGLYVKNIASGKDTKCINGTYTLYGATGVIGYSQSFGCDGEYVLVARVGSIGCINFRTGKFAVSDNTLIVQNNELSDIAFLYYRLSRFPWKSVTTGTSQPVVSASRIKETSLGFCCLAEQQKIAAFFSTLDEKIELVERKLEALEQLKKGLMQKIFSQEVRFKDSKGNDYCTWKNCSLSDISEPLSYGLNAAASEFDGLHKYLRITDIDERTYQYLSSDPVSPSVFPEEKYRLKEGDIVFARTGNSVGKTYLYDKNDGDLYYAGFLIKAHIRAGICPYFVFLQTQTPKYKNWVRIMSQRSGQPGINAEEYGKYQLLLPCLEEQEKITSLFRTLDKKIFSSIEKIKVLKQLKKGFMQQMFV